MKKWYILPALLLFLVVGTAQAEIRFGVIPLVDRAEMQKRFKPLSTYLTAHMGEDVTLTVGHNYAEVEQALAEGKLDMAFLGPVGAVKVAAMNEDVFPLVKVVKNGSGFYKSYIVALKDSPITGISQLKGKVVAFGDKGSTSSYLIPKFLLADAGVRMDELGEALLTGSHANVIRAVLGRKAVAGGVKESLALKNKDQLKFLAVSGPIPEFPICVNGKTLKERKIEKLQDVLLAIPKDSGVVQAINKKYDGFTHATFMEYTVIKYILAME
ncbi:MAG TPA: phosphate/phosphite/phosphonate ABC transporter substrate-binding protein [Desulfobulbaceae bacterium]|nr:phosphate/phosphite/phosphonate ABC transporter substrate-binding protein [Desulfobulbaceae bacterium]